MVWDGVVWYGMVWYGMACCGMVWHVVVWYGMVWYGMGWCGMVCCGMVWYGIPMGMIEYYNTLNMRWIYHFLLWWVVHKVITGNRLES